MEALWGEMTTFQDNLCNDPTEGFLQPNPHPTMLFYPLGVYTNPPPPVPPFLHDELHRHWRFELILIRAETYQVFLKIILLQLWYKLDEVLELVDLFQHLQWSNMYSTPFDQ